jgi:hypothetical protein
LGTEELKRADADPARGPAPHHAVGAVHHVVHDRVTACLDPATGGLVQLDPGLTSAGGHGGHLRMLRLAPSIFTKGWRYSAM